MKKLVKPASILLYLLSIIVFFLVGLYVAKLVGAGKNQMLAGGAIVFFYGLVSAAIALMFSFFVAYNVSHGTLVKINRFFGILFLLLALLTTYKIIALQNKEQPVEEYPKKTTAPVSQKISFILDQSTQNPNATMGIGFFSPTYIDSFRLYFYGGVNPEKGVIDHLPTDSVVFTKDQYNNPTTSYAPAWLYPEHLKLDYGILIFKVLGIGNDFVKVEVNCQTNQIAYLDKTQGTFISWTEFILSVNSVEFLNKGSQTVHLKPMVIADQIKVDFVFMQPLLVEEDWMYVRLVNTNLTEKGKGWIRWKKDNKLLVTYSLLS